MVRISTGNPSELTGVSQPSYGAHPRECTGLTLLKLAKHWLEPTCIQGSAVHRPSLNVISNGWGPTYIKEGAHACTHMYSVPTLGARYTARLTCARYDRSTVE